MIEMQADTRDIDRLFFLLENEDVKRDMLFKSVKAGAKVLQERTKDYFKRRMGEAAEHYSKYTHGSFADGVVMKGDKPYIEARVSILKDHRMKYFETGTDERYTKQKGHSDKTKGRKIENTGRSNYRGKITAKWFFKDARTSSEPLVEQAMTDTIDKEFKKLGL